MCAAVHIHVFAMYEIFTKVLVKGEPPRRYLADQPAVFLTLVLLAIEYLIFITGIIQFR